MDAETKEKKFWWGAEWKPILGWLAISAVLFGMIIAIVYYNTNIFNIPKITNASETVTVSPEIVLSGLLIIGVITLLVALSFTAVVFKSLGLADPNGVLGLPEGSVRAVIALSLILIFMMSSIFLYWQVNYFGKGTKYISNGITQEELAGFPKEEIVAIDRYYTGNNETRFTVTRLVDRTSKTAEDLAKQIITTVSTLVVAVAGFYFGTRAVSVAKGAVVASVPVIRKIEPDKGKQNEEILEFKISGVNLESPKEVKLVRDSKVMVCSDITSSPGMIRCTLRITGEAGKWTVVVKNADEEEDRLEGAFEVISAPGTPPTGNTPASSTPSGATVPPGSVQGGAAVPPGTEGGTAPVGTSQGTPAKKNPDDE